MQKISPKWKKIHWQQYNKVLIQRGSLLIWISEDVRKKWIEPKSKKNGRPKLFSDQAILTVCILRMLLSLPLRMTQGFISSIFQLIGCRLPIPHYTLVCKRMKTLDLSSIMKSKKKPAVILIDSTGLKIVGQGEWRTKRFGKEGRRGWLKVHVAIDPDTHLIHSLKVTTDEIGDATMLPALLKETPKSVKEVCADKGYDTKECRRAIHLRGARGIIPPRNGAILSDGDPFLTERDNAIQFCNVLGGDEDAIRLWRKCSGYSRRALVETAFSRWKTLFGEKIRSKLWENQEVESYIKQHIMNTLTKIGMPRRGLI